MKIKRIKRSTVAAAIVTISLVTGMQGCGDEPVPLGSTGKQALGSEETAQDVFSFTCPEGTVSAQAEVQDITATGNEKALMRVILFKDGSAAQAEDSSPPTRAKPSDVGEGSSPKSGSLVEKQESQPSKYDRPSKDAEPSPKVELMSKGSGTYLLFLFKTDEGEKTYKASAVCATAREKIHPSLKKIQNE